MDWYAKLLSPFVVAIVLFSAAYTLPTELLGAIVKYVGGGAAVVTITAYIIGMVYFVIIRGLTKIGGLAWGDVLERYLDDTDSVGAEDVPHWTRIWVAYASSLLREWFKGNFQWVSFKAYHKDMVEPLVDEYQEWSLFSSTQENTAQES